MQQRLDTTPPADKTIFQMMSASGLAKGKSVGTRPGPSPSAKLLSDSEWYPSTVLRISRPAWGPSAQRFHMYFRG